MKEFKRIISLAMVLILCVSLLPMNQNLLKAEETVDENADEFSISAKVFDGEKWVDANFDAKFDLKKVRYNIKLDQNYKKIQFFINRTKDTKKVILNCTDTYNITNNYSEALAIPAGKSVFFFTVDPYTNNLGDRYGFIVNRISSIGSIPHKIKTNNAYPECEVAYEGDIIKIKACTKTYNDKVFDKWIINSGNFEMENQGMNFTQFTMPNRDVEISSSYKEGDVNNSNLRNIYVHALKDSIWEIFNIQIDSNNISGIYNIDLKKEYSEVYLTLQEEGVLLDGNTKEQALIHLNITKDNKLIDIAEYAKYFDTEKVKLDDGENIFNINVVSKDNSSTSNYTLKINNGEVKYTVTFNSNGAEGTMQAQKIKKGEKCTLPENGFTPPENKKFAGWKIGNETKLAGDKITVNGNTEVTAIWKDIEYKVTFNNNEGTGDMPEQKVKKGTDFELPDCTFTAPDGQEFKAWSVEGQEYPAKTKIKINKETEVKAIWKDIEYKVTFNSNEGIGDMPEKTVKKGTEFELPANEFTAPEGQEFKSWEIDGQEKEVGEKITVNGDIEVKAIWQDIEYKVTFNNNEGSGDMDGKLVKAGEDFELPDCTFTAPDGQEFKTWEVDGEEYQAKEKIKINKETTVKAIWKDKTTEKFTVTINPNNNGLNESSTEAFKKGTEYTLPENNFTVPENKEFAGWKIGDEDKKPGDKITVNGNIEVTAIWQNKPLAPKPEDENKKYEIKLMPLLNGKILLNPKEAKKGEFVTVQALPDYGYELESILILDKNQKLVPMKANQFTMPKGGVSIYAKFKELAPAIYPEIDEEKPIENKRYRRDWRYDRYDEDKNTNEDEKSKAEKEIIVKESKAIITIGSQTLEKVDQGIRTVKNMDSAPYIKRGRTMLPLRYLAEALGYKVFWLNETRTVVIIDLGLRVEIPIDTNLIIVNGIKYTSDLKSEIVHHRTMLPIANIARALGLKDGEDIIWDEVNRQVTINKKSYTK